MSGGRRSSLKSVAHGIHPSGCNRPTAWAHNDWQAMTNPHHAVAHVLPGFAVLTGAFGRQQHFQHHPQSIQRAIGIGQGQAATGQLMPLRPGLSVGRRTGADAVEIGNEGVPVHSRRSRWRTVVAGGVAISVQMREVRFVHGKAPCRAIGSRHP